jgi:aminopeptidase N
MVRLPLILLTVFAATSVFADALQQCEHCAKNLLPAITKLVPGRKYARDRRIDIEHLKLDVTPDFAKRTVAGIMTMDFKPIGMPLEKLELDAVDLHVVKVTVIGAQVSDREITEDKIILTFTKPVPPETKVSVSIGYHAQPERGLYFRTPEMGYKPGDTQVWSQGEADLHRFWFPCYDYPNERFSSEVICHVPAGMETVSNGVLLSKKEVAGGLTTWHWRQDKPHVNYLIALAAGFFHKIEDKAGELPLALLVPPSQKDLAGNAFVDTRKIIEFYNREIGVPFPWDKYYQVYCLDFLAGGMENTSCTFQAAGLLFDSSTEQLRTLHWLDSHETAHQWFGDLVTCRDWSHLWLNEGFASYYTILYENEKAGADAMKYMLWKDAEDVFKANDLRPTVWRDYGDPMQQFDTRVYPKGAWILHMLRSQLGPDLYRKAIKTYIERHRNGIVGTDDLHDVIGEVSGLSFDQFFDQWLYHGGVPELKIDYAWDASTKQAKITVKQTQKITDQVRLFRLPLPVSFSIAGQNESLRFKMDVHQAEEEFYFHLPAQPELVRIDPDYTLLAKISFQPPGDMPDKQLAGDVIGRLLAVRALADRKDAASVQKLGRVLREDAFYAVRSEAAKSLAKMALPEARAALIAGLANQTDARVRLATVEALAAIPHPEAQEALARLLPNEKNPEIRAAVARSWGARAGDPQVVEALHELVNSQSFNNMVAVAAMAALRAQDEGKAVPWILERLKAAPLDFRTRDYGSALDHLAFLARKQDNREPVRQFLVQRLTDPKEEVRAAAAKALGTLRDPRSLAVLEPMLMGAKTFTDPVREAASKSVQALHTELAGPVELKNLWDQMQQMQKRTEEMNKEIDRLKKKAEPEKKK